MIAGVTNGPPATVKRSTVGRQSSATIVDVRSMIDRKSSAPNIFFAVAVAFALRSYYVISVILRDNTTGNGPSRGTDAQTKTIIRPHQVCSYSEKRISCQHIYVTYISTLCYIIL